MCEKHMKYFEKLESFNVLKILYKHDFSQQGLLINELCRFVFNRQPQRLFCTSKKYDSSSSILFTFSNLLSLSCYLLLKLFLPTTTLFFMKRQKTFGTLPYIFFKNSRSFKNVLFHFFLIMFERAGSHRYIKK